jgi:Arylsulfatase A and related enzymes
VLAEECIFFLQIGAICSLVFARPVLSSFGESPETFLEAGATARDVVLFGSFWIVGPPAVISAGAVLTRIFGPRVRAATHVVVVGILVVVLIAQELIQTKTWGQAWVWIIAAVAGVAAAWVIKRFVNARHYLTYLAGAPILFMALFVFASPTSDILEHPTSETAAAKVGVPVVFVVLDELPTASLLDGTGHIDPVLFPGFARLAASTTWYRNSTTVAAITGQAVPAILTGKYPKVEPPAPIASQYPHNLFTFLGGGASTLHVQERLTALCPPRLCSPRGQRGLRGLLGQSLDFWSNRFDHPTPSQGFFDVVGEHEDRGEAFTQFTADIDASPGTRLDFVHSVLPHVPWRLLPSGHVYDEGTDNGIAPFDYAWLDGAAARYGRSRHLLQLLYLDHQVQGLLDHLDKIGKFDDSLIVVTADHGAAFIGGEPVRATTPKSLTQIAWSPLFTKAPGQKSGRIDDRNAQSIDILPTVADMLGVKLPWPVDGRSLLGPPRAPTTKTMVPFNQNRVTTDDRGRIEIDARRGFRELLALPPAYHGNDALAWLRTGPYRDLIGRRARDIDTGPAVSVTAKLDEPGLDYQPDAEIVHILVRATVTAKEGTTVALIVNGVVAGSYQPGADHRARFAVSETMLHPGQNDLSLVVVAGPPSTPTFRPLESG